MPHPHEKVQPHDFTKRPPATLLHEPSLSTFFPKIALRQTQFGVISKDEIGLSKTGHSLGEAEILGCGGGFPVKTKSKFAHLSLMFHWI